MNIKKLITCISAVLAAILVAVTLTACGSCTGDEIENNGEESIQGDFEVGGTINGVEVEIPENEQ